MLEYPAEEDEALRVPRKELERLGEAPQLLGLSCATLLLSSVSQKQGHCLRSCDQGLCYLSPMLC